MQISRQQRGRLNTHTLIGVSWWVTGVEDNSTTSILSPLHLFNGTFLFFFKKEPHLERYGLVPVRDRLVSSKRTSESIL